MRREIVLTEYEYKVYEKIKPNLTDIENGELPAAILSYDISSKKISNEDMFAVFYKDRFFLVENGKTVSCRQIGPDCRFEAKMLLGCVQLELIKCNEATIVCRSTMKHKTEFFVIAGRLCAILEGRPLREENIQVMRFCVKCGRPLSKDIEGDRCLRCMDKRKYVKKLWEVMTGSKAYIFLSMVLFFVVTGVNLLAPQIQRILVDEYITPRNRDVLPFVFIVLSMFGINLLSRLIGILRSRILIKASTDVITRLRSIVFEKVQKLSVASVSRRTAGNIMHRVTGDTTTIQNFMTNEIPGIIEQLLMFLSVGIILFVYDWKLALLIILPMPLAIAAHRIFRNRTRKMYRRQWQVGDQVQTLLHDIFSGIRVVKSFGMEAYENRRFEKETDEECRIRIRNERFFAVFSPIVNFLMGMGEFVLLYYVGNKIISGEMTLGEMAVFSTYVSLIYGPMRIFANITRQLTMLMVAVARVFEIVDEKIDVDDAVGAIKFKIKGNIVCSSA